MLNTFTIIGDPHITPKSLDKGVKLFEQVEALGNPTIWLGDMLDTKEVIRGKCLNLVYEYFKSSKLQHIVLVGNHDWFNLECKDHSLKPLMSLSNVKVIDQAISHPTLPFMFFPYIHSTETIRQLLTVDTDLRKDTIIFGHFDVSGFDYGNGHLCEQGLDHKDFQFYKRVISGHFHKYQNVDNFTYLGTPFSHSFGEANQEKVIGVLTLDTNELTLIPTEFPRHVSLKHQLGKDSDEQLSNFIKENSGNYVRIQLHGTPENVAKLDKTKFSEINIKWEDKSDEFYDDKTTLDESSDNKTQFMDWANKIKKLDEATINLGLSILEGLNAK